MSHRLEDYLGRRRPGRVVRGVSAVLLPYGRDGEIDEAGFRRHLRRTLAAGLRPAVNMDTGYVDLLTPEEKKRVLGWTAEIVGGDGFIAGALPDAADAAKEPVALAYARECTTIAKAGGVPVVFPSLALSLIEDAGLAHFFREIAEAVPHFIAFELGRAFSPLGRIFPDETLRELVELPQCIGLKHSSLDRELELKRLDLRDRLRPDFIIYSGNDLALDMIEYGSDYLLGLSTFAPEAFAARDRAWAAGEARYLELRDFLQYLGWIGFREPVPAYKHSAAIFLALTGGLNCDEPHPRAPRRDAWDRNFLADAARRLERLLPRSVAL